MYASAQLQTQPFQDARVIADVTLQFVLRIELALKAAQSSIALYSCHGLPEVGLTWGACASVLRAAYGTTQTCIHSLSMICVET